MLVNQFIQNKFGVNLHQPPLRMENSIWFDTVTMYNIYQNLLNKHHITVDHTCCKMKTRVYPLNVPTMMRFTTRERMSTNKVVLTIFRALRKKFKNILACGYNLQRITLPDDTLQMYEILEWVQMEDMIAVPSQANLLPPPIPHFTNQQCGPVQTPPEAFQRIWIRRNNRRLHIRKCPQN